MLSIHIHMQLTHSPVSEMGHGLWLQVGSHLQWLVGKKGPWHLASNKPLNVGVSGKWMWQSYGKGPSWCGASHLLIQGSSQRDFNVRRDNQYKPALVWAGLNLQDQPFPGLWQMSSLFYFAFKLTHHTVYSGYAFLLCVLLTPLVTFDSYSPLTMYFFRCYLMT